MNADGQAMQPGMDGGAEPTHSEHSSEEDDDDTDIELLEIAALEVARKVVKELRGRQEPICLQYLARGGYNHVWLLIYATRETEGSEDEASKETQKLVLRIHSQISSALSTWTRGCVLAIYRGELAQCKSAKDKIPLPECYNIGRYADSKEYILSCYDREIYYYTHADASDIVAEAFENVTVADFVESLKAERETVSKDIELFRSIDEEPRVLVHEDFHSGNMLVNDGRLVGIIDWEFSGVYPLSELLGAIPLIQVSSPGRNELTEQDEEEWNIRYRQDLKDVVRPRAWSEENTRTVFSDGSQALQMARNVRFPEDDTVEANDAGQAHRADIEREDLDR